MYHDFIYIVIEFWYKRGRNKISSFIYFMCCLFFKLLHVIVILVAFFFWLDFQVFIFHVHYVAGLKLANEICNIDLHYHFVFCFLFFFLYFHLFITNNTEFSVIILKSVLCLYVYVFIWTVRYWTVNGLIFFDWSTIKRKTIEWNVLYGRKYIIICDFDVLTTSL